MIVTPVNLYSTPRQQRKDGGSGHTVKNYHYVVYNIIFSLFLIFIKKNTNLYF